MTSNCDARHCARMRGEPHSSGARRKLAWWKAPIALLGLGLALQGCQKSGGGGGINLPSNLPSQYVVASIDGDLRLDARVRSHRSAAGNLQTWTSDSLFQCTECPTHDVDNLLGTTSTSGRAVFGRGGSSPGIASNGRFYVMAFWGRTTLERVDAGNVSMFVAVSHDGVAWTQPHAVHDSQEVESNTGIIIPAGISVASVGSGWFASYADETGAINVVLLPVNSAGQVNTQLQPSFVTVPGASTDRAPAFSGLGNELVLAWHPSGTGTGLMILRTTDGRSWPDASTAAVAMRSGGAGPVVLGDGSPFLHRSELALFLTTTSGIANSTGAVDLLTSTDGLTWSPVSSHPVWSPSYDGAAAGPGSVQFVIVYPLTRATDPQDSLVITSANPQRTLETNTRRRVTVAGGPD